MHARFACLTVVTVTSLCLMFGTNSATAKPLDGVHQARAICSAISTSSPVRPPTVAPGKTRAESDRLVAEAAALMTRPSSSSVSASIGLLEQATTVDPGNAVAFARLSAAQGDSKRYADVPSPIAAARRWAAATKAYSLDPDNVIVLHNLAHSVVAYARDLECAERVLLRARRISPRDPDVNFGLSDLRGSRGDFKTAFADLDLAIANADADKRLALRYGSGRLYFMARDYDRVIDHFAVLIETYPTNPRFGPYFYRSLAYAAKGDHLQALAEVNRRPPGRDADAGALANLARMQVLGGQRAAGEVTLQLLLDRDARGEHVVSYQIAAVYEALGNRDETFRWLARSIEEEVDGLASWLLWLRRDPRWDPIREDPRFAEVLAKARPRN